MLTFRFNPICIMVVRGLLLAWLFFGGLTFTEQVLGVELETGGQESQNYEHVLSVLEQAIKPAGEVTNLAAHVLGSIALILTVSCFADAVQKSPNRPIRFLDPPSRNLYQRLSTYRI